jgi:hypothetical protein
MNKINKISELTAIACGMAETIANKINQLTEQTITSQMLLYVYEGKVTTLEEYKQKYTPVTRFMQLPIIRQPYSDTAPTTNMGNVNNTPSALLLTRSDIPMVLVGSEEHNCVVHINMLYAPNDLNALISSMYLKFTGCYDITITTDGNNHIITMIESKQQAHNFTDMSNVHDVISPAPSNVLIHNSVDDFVNDAYFIHEVLTKIKQTYINVCENIQCPFYKNHKCSKYLLSSDNKCHLQNIPLLKNIPIITDVGNQCLIISKSHDIMVSKIQEVNVISTHFIKAD